MGIKFFEWLRGDRGKGSTVEVSCRELFEAAQEYQVRELCFWICVNMVANAIGRCEFRTFRDGVELQDREVLPVERLAQREPELHHVFSQARGQAVPG